MSSENSHISRITVVGHASLSHAIRRALRAATRQHAPSHALTLAVNDVLDLIGDPLSTKRKRKGDEAA